jgi:hypothetical protein
VGGLCFGGTSSPESDKERTVNPATGPSCFLSSPSCFLSSSLQVRAPIAGSISLLPNFRAGGPGMRNAPEFKRGDRAWFGAQIAELPDLT